MSDRPDSSTPATPAASPGGSAATRSGTAGPSSGHRPAAGAVGSMTLLQLPASRRPNPSTVCEICPASMWMASAKAVTSYCRVMRLVSWSTDKPTVLSHCDGMHLAEQGQE